MTSQPPVYLVDDDRAVRDAVALLLSTYGLRVETFAREHTCGAHSTGAVDAGHGSQSDGTARCSRHL